MSEHHNLAGRSARRLLIAAAVGLFCASSVVSHAQRRATASKSAEISVFGGYLLWKPDYGPKSYDNGVSAGVNYTRYFHFPVAPSLEIRANRASGTYANETSYLFGLRGIGEISGRYHPYGDFMLGKGTIHYNQGNFLLGDNSTVFNYGGGVDIDVTRSFAAKIDVQAQRWRTGVSTYYHPVGLLLGVNYRIPFRKYVSQRDLR